MRFERLFLAGGAAHIVPPTVQLAELEYLAGSDLAQGVFAEN
jgi:hypothetical protein